MNRVNNQRQPSSYHIRSSSVTATFHFISPFCETNQLTNTTTAMQTPTLVASSSSAAVFPLSSYSAISPSSSSILNLANLSRRSKPSYPSAVSLKVQSSSSPMIEKETPKTQRPNTFLRETDDNHSQSSTSNSVRARFEKMIREVQDSVCSSIEAVDQGGKFNEDVWSRPGGGGGISRVLQDGAVWEKAGVNVSVVYGVMPPEAYRAANPLQNGNTMPGPVPFFAAGISSVISLTASLCPLMISFTIST